MNKVENLPNLLPRDKLINQLMKHRKDISELLVIRINKDGSDRWAIGGSKKDSGVEHQIIGILEEVKGYIVAELLNQSHSVDWIE